MIAFASIIAIPIFRCITLEDTIKFYGRIKTKIRVNVAEREGRRLVPFLFFLVFFFSLTFRVVWLFFDILEDTIKFYGCFKTKLGVNIAGRVGSSFSFFFSFFFLTNISSCSVVFRFITLEDTTKFYGCFRTRIGVLLEEGGERLVHYGSLGVWVRVGSKFLAKLPDPSESDFHE